MLVLAADSACGEGAWRAALLERVLHRGGGVVGSAIYAAIYWAGGSIGAALALAVLFALGLSLLTGITLPPPSLG